MAASGLVKLLRLVFAPFVPYPLQELRDVRQTALPAGLGGLPSYLEVPAAVTRAVEGHAQTRAGLQTLSLRLGVPLGNAADGHQAGRGRLSG